jgi:hypothetical protein
VIDMGNGQYLGNVFIRRKEMKENYVKHYTTKVIETKDGEIIALDGFGYTDRGYIWQFKHEKRLNLEIYGRQPRRHNGNYIFIAKDGNNDILIPKMSADIMGLGRYEDVTKFYLKPLLKQIDYKSVDDLLKDALVIYENGIIGNADSYKAEYFPLLHELSYDKPDYTITLYTYSDDVYSDVIDVYGNYYFVVHIVKRFCESLRVLRFLGYVKDIEGIIPPIRCEKEYLDPWRVINRIEQTQKSDWIRITNREWCGAWSKSSQKLYELEETLKQMLRKGLLESLATVIAYSSNVFVNYVDFFIKPRIPLKRETFELMKDLVNKIQILEIKEIFENIFHL